MSEKPIISVIMAAYNAEKYIGQAIESILNQTFSSLELIIIDDCSSDKTFGIAQGYQKKDDRIILLRNTDNLYATKTRNRAIRMARGKHVAIQDADDISLPLRLEKQYNFLESNSDIFLVGSGAYIIDELDVETGRFIPISDSDTLSNILKRRNAIYHPTIFFRNQGVLYREKIYYSEDYDFYLNLLSSHKQLVNLREPLVMYRVLGNSVSRGKAGQQAMFAEKAREFYRERVERGYDDYDSFDPVTILNMDGSSNNRVFLRGELEASFKLGDYLEVRRLAKKYIANHGLELKFVVLYVSSFLGTQGILIFRRALLVAENLLINRWS